MSPIQTALQKIHVHHPALLRIAQVTQLGDVLILDNLSSLTEERIEQDVIFPLECPATIKVTILTGQTYTYTIPLVAMPPEVFIEHLDDIGDVNVPSPTDGYRLAWDSATQLWIARENRLDGLADVDTEGALDGDCLAWNEVMQLWTPLTLPATFPPEAHAISHKFKQSDELDIKDLFLTMVNSLFYRMWGSADGWTEGKYGSASITYERIFVNLGTGASNGSYACIYCNTALWLTPEVGYLFKMAITPWITETANQEGYIGVFTNPTAPTATEKHIAFKILDGAVYATNANGTSQKITDTGISVANARDKLWYIRATTTSIEFYIDRTLVVTHTQYIPQSFDAKMTIYIKTTAGANKSVFAYPLFYARTP